MITAEKIDAIGRDLRKLPQVSGLYTLSGDFDLLTVELGSAIDQVGRIDGVERTQTSILLAVKFER